MGAPDIAKFLAWLATERRVSSSTQNQAFSAILFLYKHVLRIDVGAIEDVPRGKMPHRLPVVLSVEEVGRFIQQVRGTMWIVVALLYGAGLRLQECLELRVKDIDFDQHQIVVRRGKGQKDRVTLLPAAVEERLRTHLREVKALHARDLAGGFGRVVLPTALDRKGPRENNVDRCGRRGARPAGREERAYRAYVSDEQRSPAGCIGVRNGNVILSRALSIRMRRPTGAGSSCFRRGGFVGTHDSGRRPAIICTSLSSNGPWPTRLARRALRSMSGTTPCAIRLRPTYSPMATTFERCRSCSVMRMSVPRCSTHTC
jgi:hypothetical protein